MKCTRNNIYGNLKKNSVFQEIFEIEHVERPGAERAIVTTDRREVSCEDVHWVQLAPAVPADKPF